MPPLINDDRFAPASVLAPKSKAGLAFVIHALNYLSSLCGACNEVCPVDIPIPDLLLRLRNKAKREGISAPGSPPMAPFAALATSPKLWRAAMNASRAMNHIPAKLVPAKPLQDWLALRTLPRWRGGEFRRWVRDRS